MSGFWLSGVFTMPIIFWKFFCEYAPTQENKRRNQNFMQTLIYHTDKRCFCVDCAADERKKISRRSTVGKWFLLEGITAINNCQAIASSSSSLHSSMEKKRARQGIKRLIVSRINTLNTKTMIPTSYANGRNSKSQSINTNRQVCFEGHWKLKVLLIRQMRMLIVNFVQNTQNEWEKWPLNTPPLPSLTSFHRLLVIKIGAFG